MLKNTFYLITLLCAILCFQSCTEEEGCTDPNAENYSVDAQNDDGSCTYARTKFVGTYGAGESCNGGDASSIIVSIVNSDTATNAIEITNETLGVTVTGIVTDNSFTIDDSFMLNGASVNMVGSGIYSVEDSKGRIDVQYTLDATTSCIGVWLKS